MTIKVTLTGTGSPLPDPNRAGPSSLVQAGGQHILIDAGRGIGLRLPAAGVLPPMISAILLTHLHSDHICDLNDIVTSRWIMSPVKNPTVIYGPIGTQKVVDGMLAMLSADEHYRLDHHDDLRAIGGMSVIVHEVKPGDTFTIGEVSIGVHRTDHRPVAPTIGYRIEHGGVVAAIAGDTIPCDELDVLCAEADIYVQTVLREDLVRAFASMLPTQQRFLDILDYHSSVQQAAQTASRCGVKTLVLTHYVPAPPPGQEEEWRALAAEHFAGDIVVGPDLTVVER